jgi:hypothetical protein
MKNHSEDHYCVSPHQQHVFYPASILEMQILRPTHQKLPERAQKVVVISR